ncbi:hypothetical protein [Hymenobacter persicinus]|uniref:Uncharacterized protein n=1 Tax=Hymenobacter persicinus TaxID=2025506 RepID=A0A4Q5LF73_9BACT|nr:hypothetical protein [Hymenobacter persicinus]RYU81259.1 hypothetical protein EWM57_06695 [Hymenobacter persicinus]
MISKMQSENQTKGSFIFNKIWIIESLGVVDKPTGTILYNDLIKNKSSQLQTLDSELAIVKDYDELVSVLDRIKSDVQDKHHFPFIHFEIHGSNDKMGLVLASSQFVSWTEFASLLREINIETRNNTMVTTAVCFGGRAFIEIDPVLPAPFAGIVGPYEAVYVNDIEEGYNAFFDLLLNGNGFDKALTALNGYGESESKFEFIPAIGLFNILWSDLLTMYKDPLFMENKIFALTYRSFASWNARGEEITMTIEQVKAYYRNLYTNDNELDEMKSAMMKTFIMADLDPLPFVNLDRPDDW